MLKVRKAMNTARPGTRAIILATDPGTEQDLRDFCAAYGFVFLAGETHDGVLRAVIKKC
jgi:TusA-related sulfurtransferase